MPKEVVHALHVHGIARSHQCQCRRAPTLGKGRRGVGGTIEVDADPFAHPDAMRRFRVLTNVEELERALEFPWEKWTVFLHPAQHHLVERTYNGPARISGSAGTARSMGLEVEA